MVLYSVLGYYFFYLFLLGLSYPVPMIGAANAVAGIFGVMTAIWKSFPLGESFIIVNSI